MPQSAHSSECSNFRFALKLPGEHSFIIDCLPMNHIHSTLTRSINYIPPSCSIGVNQAVDLYFIYELNENTYCFYQQIHIDIYPSKDNRNKILENLTVNIGSISQEGKAGDPRISFLENINSRKASGRDAG